MRPASSSARRSQPWLGTFVEIQATGPSMPAVHAAIDDAFSAVAAVHRLMSFHETASDVSRINRRPANEAVPVHPWTYEVLKAAVDLNERSDGAFDVTVAPALQALGLLPPSPEARSHRTRSSAAGAIELLADAVVAMTTPDIRIDLGGIAKGFAVDRAVEVLIEAEMIDGLVNAGGDLRTFGAEGHRVHVRDPRDPRRALTTVTLTDAALATTGGRFDPFLGPRPGRPAVIDPRWPDAAPAIVGVTVRAPSCMVADGLTKVVMLAGEGALPVLDAYAASAMFVSSDGRVTLTSDWAGAPPPADAARPA
jgi:FAD:protein FMN transferase